MSVKQRLEYGIYPIASRRHQPRDNWGTFHEFDHQWTHEGAVTVVGIWIIVPILCFVASLLSDKYNFGQLLFLGILLNLYMTWAIKRGD